MLEVGRPEGKKLDARKAGTITCTCVRCKCEIVTTPTNCVRLIGNEWMTVGDPFMWASRGRVGSFSLG